MIQKDLVDMGCMLTDIIHGFNEYIGAQKLGRISTFYRYYVSPNAYPLILHDFKEPLYTGDINPIIRTYICTKCKTKYLVGKNQKYLTIEQLKKIGCSKCNNNKFQKKQEKKME